MELGSIFGGVGAKIYNGLGREEGIAHEHLQLGVALLNMVFPTNRFVGKPLSQLLSSDEPVLCLLDFVI